MPSIPDPFALLGLPPTFDLSASQVETAYLQRAAAAHPDLAHPSNADEADDLSGQLNDARQILLDPERRANALLAIRGGPPKEADKSLPPAFLVEIMQAREEIEDALAARDPDRLRSWRDWAHTRRSDSIARVAALFREASPHILVEIRTTLNAWRYIERLIDQLDSPAGPR